MKTKKSIVIIALMFLFCVSLAAFSACGFVNSDSSGSGNSSNSSGGVTDDCSLGHNYENGVCTRCGDIELQPTADEYFIFKKNDDGYAVYANKEKELPAEIVIPSEYNGKTVTSIEYWAFFGCSGLTKITIPDSVTSIGDRAFMSCSGLTSITIPNSVTSIGEAVFYDCSGLTSITIPNSVTSIGNGAFMSCSGLEKIEVGENNKVYHSDGNCLIETETKTLIAGCKNSIIPSDGSVASIGYGAFVGCSGLTNVSIPNSVTSIGYGAFYDCSGLTNIVIPDCVTSISHYTFLGCSGLEKIEVGENNKVYHSDGNCLIETETKTLIAGCKNSIIPSDGNVTFIGKRAFSGCSELTSITIPDCVTSIGDYAFSECRGLMSVTIPDSVTKIGDSAFMSCSGLTKITIPDSVTSVGGVAFGGCSGLTSITIPNSVTYIGNSAFV